MSKPTGSKLNAIVIACVALVGLIGGCAICKKTGNSLSLPEYANLRLAEKATASNLVSKLDGQKPRVEVTATDSWSDPTDPNNMGNSPVPPPIGDVSPPQVPPPSAKLAKASPPAQAPQALPLVVTNTVTVTNVVQVPGPTVVVTNTVVEHKYHTNNRVVRETTYLPAPVVAPIAQSSPTNVNINLPPGLIIETGAFVAIGGRDAIIGYPPGHFEKLAQGQGVSPVPVVQTSDTVQFVKPGQPGVALRPHQYAMIDFPNDTGNFRIKGTSGPVEITYDGLTATEKANRDGGLKATRRVLLAAGDGEANAFFTWE